MVKPKKVVGEAKTSIKVNRSRDGGKKKIDLFANLRNQDHPLDDMFPVPASLPEQINQLPVQPAEKIKPDTTGTTGYTSTTSTSNTTDTTKKTRKDPVSPIRDFTKTPNSLTRVILAQGLFRGKSKQIYDYLWSVSRGAIKPLRTFRKTHKEIMKGGGIGSRNTVIDGLRHLETIGLVKILSSVGVSVGNEYEIFTPDELGYTGATDTTGITDTIGISQNLVIPVQPISGTTGTTQTIENKDDYITAKTSFKDNKKDDDEPFGAMIEMLSQTGAGKREDWRELGALLKMEFDIAASRTKGVTNAPKFLAEHLRRRLIGKSELPKPKTAKTSQFGKQQPIKQVEAYQPEPLSKEGRESTLKTFLGYIEKGQKDFLMSLQDTYTKEDWNWLMDGLKEK